MCLEVMDCASLYSPPKVGSGGYCRYHRLKAGNTVVLDLHAKPQLEGLPCGAGRPPLGRSAWGCHHVSTAFRIVPLIISWLWLAVACARPTGLGEAGRPPSGPSRPLGLPRLCYALVPSPGKWVAEIYLILGCLVDLWMDVEAFRCIQLNQSPTLDSKPYECVSWPLD